MTVHPFIVRIIAATTCSIAWVLTHPITAWAVQDAAVDQQPPPLNTQALEIPFTPPEEAVERFRLPDGFSMSLFAAEPDVQQPIAVTTDHRGRLWVVECFTYSDRKTNYDMRQKDRVVIFEDSDHDGRFDQRTVFWDQGEKLTGIEVGLGGVWLTSAPHFLFIPDADQDDRPDGPPQVLLDGFEDDVIRHNIVNGLRWGHDGWLYGRHGIQATSFVGPPKSTRSQRIAMNCSIWRFHPKHEKFEIVAEGGTNPWGFDFDQHGEMFMINTVIGHLFHVVPGARYRRMYGAHFNPHTYQVIEQTADHFHFAKSENWSHVQRHGISEETDRAGGGHAHTGLMIYLGNNWPAQYRNGLFTANFHGGRINWDRIQRDGNGYTASHAPELFPTTDPWFRGVEMVYGPDGAVFLLDWSDIGECHENDGIHRTSGRIYKITYGKTAAPKRMDELKPTELLSHPNEWYFRKFRRRLQETAYQGKISSETATIEMLRRSMTASNADTTTVLRSLWTLYSAGELEQHELLELLGHADEHVRSWGVRLLTDGLFPIDGTTEDALHQLAADEPSGLVRLYLASGLRRLPAASRLKLAKQLTQYADANDRTQPSLIWFAIEPVVCEYPRQSVELAKASRFPQLSENIVRRLAFENDRTACRAAVSELLDFEWNAQQKKRIIQGIDKAFAGWAPSHAIDGWENFVSEVNSEMKRHPESVQADLRQAIDRIQLAFGKGPSIAELMEVARNGQIDPLIRQQAIRTLAPMKPENLFAFLKSLAGDKSVLTEVNRAFIHCTEEDVATVVINRFGNADQEGKSAAISTLCARPAWAARLLKAAENRRIPVAMITAWHARRIHQFQNNALTAKLKSVWGEVQPTNASRRERIEELKRLLNDDAIAKASLDNGRVLFEKQCATCHVLNGRGSRIGPDLTGSDRRNLNYLLENLVHPSAMVAESYQMRIFLLQDGRTISGLVLEENEKALRIQTPDAVVSIARDDLEEQRRTKLSLMPDGLMDSLTPQQQIDLIGFLKRN